MDYLFLLVGFVLLIKGADLFVDGASSVARLLRVPSFLVGLTIVAIGTSAPEAAVSISAGFSGSSAISVGNIIGSNLFNLLVVVGLTALICPPKVERAILNRDLWWSIGGALLLLLFLYDHGIARWEGGILLAGAVFYLGWIVRSALRARRTDRLSDLGSEGDAAEAAEPKMSILRSILYVLFGLTAVILGGNLVVDSASAIAVSLGMDETLVGLTVVAIGTSLPELVTSIVAAAKKDSGLALGNVMGSNILNVFFILGMSSLIRPITAEPGLWVDLALLLAASLLVFLCCFRKMRVPRVLGGAFLATYAGYAVFIVLRGTGQL